MSIEKQNKVDKNTRFMGTIMDSVLITHLTRHMQDRKRSPITLLGLDEYADAFIESDEFCDTEGDFRH